MRVLRNYSELHVMNLIGTQRASQRISMTITSNCFLTSFCPRALNAQKFIFFLNISLERPLKRPNEEFFDDFLWRFSSSCCNRIKIPFFFFCMQDTPQIFNKNSTKMSCEKEKSINGLREEEKNSPRSSDVVSMNDAKIFFIAVSNL